jgi:hypothetical protein
LTAIPDACARRRALVVAVCLIAWHVATLPAQGGLTASVAGAVLRVKAAGFRFLEGEALSRLKDGRSVRFDFDLSVLTRPGGPAVTQGRESFNLSYDLWEERFAAARIGTPARSASHLTPALAEAWCLDQLTLPVGTFSHLGRDTPFWVRLAYTIVERQRPASPDADARFTIWSLIDVFSRRTPEALSASVEGGPFRLSD